MNLEKLSSTDRVFFDIEGASLMMHIGAVMVFDGGDFVASDGALDFARLRRLFEASVASIPRFRQVVRDLPGLGAVWVDDAHYRIERHLRDVALPRPGDDHRLMELAGSVFSRPLDRRRPLWEVVFVEGLSEGRFALIIKAHHAMVDGVAGMALIASLLRAEPGDDPPAPPPWTPTPAPGTFEVAAALVSDSARSVVQALRDLRASPAVHARDIAEGLFDTLRDGLMPASPSSINPADVGPDRVFAGVRLELARAKSVRRALGGTLNDVVLAVVTGALRRYLARRGDPVDALRDFRTLVPVDLRARQGDAVGFGGNHISLVLAHLPVHVAEARARYAAVHDACEHLKHTSHEIEGAAFIERIGDLGGPNVVSAVFRIASMLRAFNVTITNVVGPQVPLYLGRSRMASLYAVVPLFTHQGVGVAVASYDGSMYVGIYADPDAVPDVDTLARDVNDSFEELCAVAAP